MNQLKREKIHQIIYYFSLALLIACLPLSLYLLSIAQFLLILNWIAEGEFKVKLRRLRYNYPALIFASVFVVYFLGFLFSEEKDGGLDKLKDSLSYLVIPLIVSTTRSPGQRNINRLFVIFCLGVTAAAIACIVNYMINGIPANGDYRQISIILPHLRFALLIAMAILIMAYFGTNRSAIRKLMYDSTSSNDNLLKSVFIVNALFLTAFLFFLRSATGIMIFLLTALVLIINIALRTHTRFLRIAGTMLPLFLIVSALAFAVYFWRQNFSTEKISMSDLETHTANGNRYFHNTDAGLLENGYYTELYICEPELKREWEKISKIGYDDADLKGQPLKSTLKRYLTSKGLRKDSLSVHKLTPTDIENIEGGLANHKFCLNPGIYQRLYETMYEIHVYNQSGFMEKHTFGQRLAFARESLRLIRANKWIGTGTGDVFKSLREQAVKDKVAIDPKWEGSPHNQFAYYLLAFGIPGFIWILFSWFYPAIRFKAGKSLLFNLFSIVILISMLVMDTLESYSSMIFFILFYSLLVFCNEETTLQRPNETT